MEETYKAAVAAMTKDASAVIDAVREGARLAMQPQNTEQLAAIEREIIALQEKAIGLHKKRVEHLISDSTYNNEVKQYSQQMEQLEARQAELRADENRFNEVKTWLDTFERYTKSGKIVTATDTVVMRAMVDHIMVYDDHIEVIFKCGGSVKQAYVK